MRRAPPVLFLLPAVALVALPLLRARADDEWAARAATGAKVRGQAVAALSSEGFTLGGVARSWREEPLLSFEVLRATVRAGEKRRDLIALARFAFEERLWAEARSALAELPDLDVDTRAIEAASAFHASGSLRRGALDVPLGARDFDPTSLVGPLMKRLLPEQVLGSPVARPGGVTLEPSGGALVLRGMWPRAYGRTLTVLPSSEVALVHEGVPSPNAYFGFDLVTAEEQPLRALYAVASDDGTKIDLQLVDGRGHALEHATTRPLARTAKLRLVAGPTCRLLADGHEVARLAATAAFVADANARVRPVLAVAAGTVAHAEARYGALTLAFQPEPAWLERATAPARSRIRRELHLEPERFVASGPHFSVETDLGPSSLAGFASDTEAAFAAFERALGPARAGERVDVRIFGAEDDYRDFVVAQGRGEEKCLGGFFDPRTNAIIMRVDEASPRARLVHETFHAYAARALPELPVWLNEGLAEREALRFVQFAPRRRRGPLLDALRGTREWRALFVASAAEFHDRGARALGQRSLKEKRYYTLSWSLCELAARKPDGPAGKLVARALEAARRGEALDAGSIDEKALDDEWTAFARETTR